MSEKKLEVPRFASEAEEREFWETHDTTDYVDWSKAKRVSFPNLKPSTAPEARARPRALPRSAS